MKHTLETNEAALKRWRTRLKRALSMVDKLEKQRKRMEAAPKMRVKVTSHPVANPDNVKLTFESVVEPVAPAEQVKPEPLAVTIVKELAAPEPDLDIPEFLRRGIAAQKAVNAIIDEGTAALKQEIEETKRRKTKGRIEKMKAKQRGDLKKMPLSGKAALQMIDSE